MGGGSEGSHEPTDAERLEQARILYEQMWQRAEALEQKMEQLEKGNQPGRDPLRHVGPQTDRFSLPCPDNYGGPPSQGPMGTYPVDRPPPMGEVKPILIEKPEPFEGAHNNIERFIRDCVTYFEVFRWHYQSHPALMVVFALSLFKGLAKDWWVHLHDQYQYTTADKAEDYNGDPDEVNPPFHGGPQYHFPDWETFTGEVREQFCDPTIELVHERRLLELKMTRPAYLFF